MDVVNKNFEQVCQKAQLYNDRRNFLRDYFFCVPTILVDCLSGDNPRVGQDVIK